MGLGGEQLSPCPHVLMEHGLLPVGPQPFQKWEGPCALHDVRGSLCDAMSVVVSRHPDYVIPRPSAQVPQDSAHSPKSHRSEALLRKSMLAVLVPMLGEGVSEMLNAVSLKAGYVHHPLNLMDRMESSTAKVVEGVNERSKS